MTQPQETARYTGLTRYVDPKNGYAIWLPKGWAVMEMIDRDGMVFSPDPKEKDTVLSIERKTLKYEVRPEDLDILEEGFLDGINMLPGVKIDRNIKTDATKILGLDAGFTFLEDGKRRKRWTRLIYTGKTQLVIIAQGATEAEFDYYLPIFHNMIMTMTLA